MADVAVMYQPHRVSLDGTGVGVLELEATVSESHQLSNEVTEHAVEDGSPVADHVRQKSDVLTLEAIISNTPIMQGDQLDLAAADGVYSTTRSKGAPGPADAAYALLRQLKEKAALCTVATRLRTYESMVIETVSIPRDSKRGDALHFTVTLKQLRIVSSKAVSYAKEPRGKKKENLGDKQKSLATDKQSRSAAAALFDGADDALNGF